MTDIEDRLRAAMHAAVDGKDASASELIGLVKRRHRRHVIRVVCITVVATLAVAVPAAITLPGSGGAPPAQRPRHLPTKMTGLPLPSGTNFQLLISVGAGAAWYSTATRRIERVSGLPRSQGGYQFTPVYGGWIAASNATASASCSAINPCAGPPQELYLIADHSLTATRIGAGYAGVASNRPGAVWLTTYRRATVKLNTGSATAQLVSSTGRPLSPRYRLPAGYLVGSGVGNDLLLYDYRQQNLTILWDPRTGRVLRHFHYDVQPGGPGQIAWSAGCRSCELQIINVSTGTILRTPIPGRNPAALNVSFSDDGRFLAVQRPGHDIEVFDTVRRTLTVIPGTALASAEWQYWGWQPGGHRLVISAGPNSGPGPAQLAYWQPGDAVLRVATVRNLAEVTELQSGQLG